MGLSKVQVEILTTNHRSSSSRMFFKMGLLKISQYSRRKTIVLKSLSNKVFLSNIFIKVSLLNRNSNTGAFLLILRNF